MEQNAEKQFVRSNLEYWILCFVEFSQKKKNCFEIETSKNFLKGDCVSPSFVEILGV